jgi:hypothetical protein
MHTLHRAELEIFADYHQFYVQDGGVEPDAPTDWTDTDIGHRVKVEENVVVVCPLRNMSVPVVVEVTDSEPPFTFEGLDHIVSCSLRLPTGCLQVHECTGGERLRLSIAAGTYRMLIFFSGLNSISASGLEGNDQYRVVLWQGSDTPLIVLKEWVAPAQQE